MSEDVVPADALHNVAETVPAPWTENGEELSRIPASVAADLNVAARDRVRHPAGCELRVCPESPTSTISVTLSAADRTIAWPFWGEFQSADPIEIGPEPRRFEFSLPEQFDRLQAGVREASAFDPGVCRIRFGLGVPVAIHDVTGDWRPPTEEEVPNDRLLVYGTSITEGADVSAPHLGYVPTLARSLGVDAIDLGLAGAAYCEPAIGEYVADRSDWDACVCSVSVNMANRGFTVEQFRERAAELIETIAAARPDAPIAAVSLYPFHMDVVEGDDLERASAYRSALESVVADAPANVSLVDGPEVMAPTGLTTDLLHPGDAGHAAIAEGIADHLREREW